ncbi:MAG: HAD family hydrolase [Pseudohongiellaceae bacterium]
MDLIFFDLDGTLLDDDSEISVYTRDTLTLLKDSGIAYTVATGRTMLSAKAIIAEHNFELPQIYNNGVTIWNPKVEELTLENVLDISEISSIISMAALQGITPFVHTIDDHHHSIYHAHPQHEIEHTLINKHYSNTDAKLFHLDELPAKSQVTNISMIGSANTIDGMWHEVNSQPHLVAYSGPALEGGQYRWMDIHHRLASKGSAVTKLREKLGATNVICFGDSDNDLSMFELADESYAPENAKQGIKDAASAVIGHNHEDGIARFLRERFSL